MLRRQSKTSSILKGPTFPVALQYASKVKCPTLLAGGENDTMTPFKYLRRAAKRMGDKATLFGRPCTHMEAYNRVGIISCMLKKDAYAKLGL